MDVTQLMVDDWVKVDDKIGQVKMVTEFDVCVQVSEIEMINSETVEPIEITDDFLVANGFEKQTDWFVRQTSDIMLKKYEDKYRIVTSPMMSECQYLDTSIIYVHQLQHIMSLLNIKQKIKIEINE